jgi:CRP-like cAMP-binding protein
MDDVAFLRALPAFRSLSEDEVARLVRAGARRSFGPGQGILRRGEPGNAMYVLLQGAVQVPLVDERGERRALAYLGPGDLFGEMALLTGEPRAADVTTDGEAECVCLVLDKALVEELLRTKPRVARFLTEILGQRLLASSQLRHVGKYLVLGQIGKGGASVVFEGLHPTLKRSVAIKMLSHELVYEQGFAERFALEARIVAELRHENIVQIYDQEAAFATFFIVMERLDGQELSRLLEEGGPLSVEECRHILHQASRGLGYAHGQGVIHRDIKPSNLFIEDTGRVKIMDFGIAIGARVEVKDEGGLMGTPGYIAPEGLLGEGVDARADLYALGVCAYEMLAGRSPFAHKDLREVLSRQLAAPFLDVREACPDAPDDLVAFIKRATQRDRAERYSCCAEVVELFDQRQAPRAEAGLCGLDIQIEFSPEERAHVEAAVTRLHQQLGLEVPGARVAMREMR